MIHRDKKAFVRTILTALRKQKPAQTTVDEQCLNDVLDALRIAGYTVVPHSFIADLRTAIDKVDI